MTTATPSRFSAPPLVEVVPEPTGGKLYVLHRDLWYRTDVIEGGEWIRIPAGFPSDGASVPRWAWTFFPPSGQYTGAAIVHDFICHEKIYGYKKGALIFDEAMVDLGVPWRVRWPMVKAVRWFGPRF